MTSLFNSFTSNCFVAALPWINLLDPMFGVTGNNVTDDGPAIATATAYVSGTGQTLVIPYANFYSTQPITFNQCKVVSNNAQFNFNISGNAIDCVTFQGSSPEFPLIVEGNLKINCNNTGRDGVVFSGGNTAQTQTFCDHFSAAHVEVINSFRDGFHFEGVAVNNWIQNGTLMQLKAFKSGRHGYAFVCGKAGTFINCLTFINCETRGAGQNNQGAGIAGADIYLELSGNVASQQVSSIKWIVPEFDALGAPNHGQYSMLINLLGTNMSAVAWNFDTATMEDTGTVITGSPLMVKVIGTGTFSNVLGWKFDGMDGSDYGFIANPTQIPFTASCGIGSRDIQIPFTQTQNTYANDAAAAASGLITVGGAYRRTSDGALVIRQA